MARLPRVPPSPGRRPCGWAGRVAALVAGAATDVVRLVLPVACAGCARADVPWCAHCAALLAGPAVRRDADAPRLDLVTGGTLLPVLAPATLVGPVRHAVVAWKDRGRADLDRVVARRARCDGHVLAGLLAADGEGDPRAPRAGDEGVRARDAGSRGAGVLVVAVPSTAAARRRRGRTPVAVLARGVARGLREAGVPCTSRAVLVRAAGADLAGLGAGARAAALAGRVRVRRGVDLRGRDVVLVDDVLTTGATLATCHRVLVAAGARVRAAWTLAATPAPAPARVPGPLLAAGPAGTRPARRQVRGPRGPR